MVKTTEQLPPATGGSQGTSAPGPAVSDVPATTRSKPLGLLMIITGVIGWIASGILALEKLEALRDPNHITSCDINPWVSCGDVMKTWQSSLFGFPNMFIGIVAFAVIITTGMALLSGGGLRTVVLDRAADGRDAGNGLRRLAVVPGVVRDRDPLPVLHGGLGHDDSPVHLGHHQKHNLRGHQAAGARHPPHRGNGMDAGRTPVRGGHRQHLLPFPARLHRHVRAVERRQNR